MYETECQYWLGSKKNWKKNHRMSSLKPLRNDFSHMWAWGCRIAAAAYLSFTVVFFSGAKRSSPLSYGTLVSSLML